MSKYASREAKSIVCHGGPRAVVAVNHNGSSVGTSSDATARPSSFDVGSLRIFEGFGAVVAMSNHKEVGKLQFTPFH